MAANELVDIVLTMNEVTRQHSKLCWLSYESSQPHQGPQHGSFCIGLDVKAAQNMHKNWRSLFEPAGHFDVRLLGLCERDDEFRADFKPSYLYPAIGACVDHVSGIIDGVRKSVWDGHWCQEGARGCLDKPKEVNRVLRAFTKKGKHEEKVTLLQ